MLSVIYCGSELGASSPLSRHQTIGEMVKAPLKEPTHGRLGNLGPSPVMGPATLALALRHFCVGRWLPNLPLNVPGAGPALGLAHR